MGMWFLTAIGEFDTEVCEEVAKYYKVDVKIVLKHYKEFIEKVKNDEIKD